MNAALATSVEYPNTQKILHNIGRWNEVNILYSKEFRELKAQQLGYTLAEEWERRLGIGATFPQEVILHPEIERQKTMIIAYFNLVQAKLCYLNASIIFDGFLSVISKLHEMTMHGTCVNFILVVFV
jgi:hypothetical protein